MQVTKHTHELQVISLNLQHKVKLQLLQAPRSPSPPNSENPWENRGADSKRSTETQALASWFANGLCQGAREPEPQAPAQP